MKTIILNIGENGTVVSSDNNLGNSGEHNKTVLRIIISDESLSVCDYFRVWFDNRYSGRLFTDNGTIEYEVPQDSLTPPSVKFQLCGYKGDENGINYISKSEKYTFSVETSDSSRALCEHYIEPAELLSYECGISAQNAKDSADRAQNIAAECIAYLSETESNKQAAAEHSQTAETSAQTARSAVQTALESAEEALEHSQTAEGFAQTAETSARHASEYAEIASSCEMQAMSCVNEVALIADSIDERLSYMPKIDAVPYKNSKNLVSSGSVYDLSNYYLIHKETVGSGTENLEYVFTNPKAYENGGSDINCLYYGEVILEHSILPGTLVCNVHRSDDEEAVIGTLSDDGEGNIVTELPNLVGTVNYTEGKITFTELGINFQYSYLDVNYSWSCPEKAVIEKNFGKRYKKIIALIKLAGNPAYENVVGTIEVSSSNKTIHTLNNEISLPLSTEDANFIRFQAEIFFNKAVSESVSVIGTNGDTGIPNASAMKGTPFVDIGKDYIKDLKFEAKDIIFSNGSQIEIYGVLKQ